MVTGRVAGSGSGFGGGVDENGMIANDRTRKNVDVHRSRIDRCVAVVASGREKNGVVTDGGSGARQDVEIHRRGVDSGVLRSFGRDEN